MKLEVKHLVPLRDQILVKIEQENVTKTGLFMPIETKESRAPTIGLVIAIGDGKMDGGEKAEINFKSGDTILFNSWSVTELSTFITEEGAKYVLMPAKDVLAKVQAHHKESGNA